MGRDPALGESRMETQVMAALMPAATTANALSKHSHKLAEVEEAQAQAATVSAITQANEAAMAAFTSAANFRQQPGQAAVTSRYAVTGVMQ